MPQKMASGTQTIFYWNGNTTPPASYKKWTDMVTALLSAQVPFAQFQYRNLPDYGIHILCFLQFEWFFESLHSFSSPPVQRWICATKEYQEQLSLVQKEIGFSHIRGHGLFCDDIGIYQETPEGESEYNFTYLDRVMDSYISLGLRPFLELGFMPQKMASGTQTIFYWNGNTTPPASYKKWTDMVTALLSAQVPFAQFQYRNLPDYGIHILCFLQFEWFFESLHSFSSPPVQRWICATGSLV